MNFPISVKEWMWLGNPEKHSLLNEIFGTYVPDVRVEEVGILRVNISSPREIGNNERLDIENLIVEKIGVPIYLRIKGVEY